MEPYNYSQISDSIDCRMIGLATVYTCHAKLLNPRTRMVMPVNCATPLISESNSFISCGKTGAIARGPSVCAKVTSNAEVMVVNFQKRFQF